MYHKFFNYEGYEKYGITGIISGESYLRWTNECDKLISNQNIKWDKVFKSEPYLIYKPDPKGNIFPQFQVFSYRGGIDFDNNDREKEYVNLIERFGLKGNVPILV